MPRVSEAHLAARRQQILDAARTCFVRNGFHGTSMQDVIAEASLSVGAVYRYFKSKSDIIEAIAEQYRSQISGVLESITGDPGRPLADVMAAAFDIMDAQVGPDGALRIAVQVWAEAVRDERAAELAGRFIHKFREQFILVAQRAIVSGELPPSTDAAQAGNALFSLVIGYGLQKLLTGSPSPAAYTAGVRALLAR